MNPYLHQPPDVPAFFYSFMVSAWRDLIYWAKRENVARLSYLSRNGHFLEYRREVRDSSPVMLLAKHPLFRKFCAKMSESTWKQLTSQEKDMIINALDLREKLTRKTPKIS